MLEKQSLGKQRAKDYFFGIAEFCHDEDPTDRFASRELRLDEAWVVIGDKMYQA